MFTRRAAVLAGVGFAAGGALPARAAKPTVVVHKDPSCGCCGSWADHLRAAGYPVGIVETGQLNPLKAEKGVPRDLWSCHTAEVEGYVIEGHVPARQIDRLLFERPMAVGLAVAGMPIGSPGMEVEGHEPHSYDVVLFGDAGRSVFARYVGPTLMAS